MKKYISLIKFIIPLFCIFVSVNIAQASTDKASDDSIVLTFLGTGAPRPSMDRYGAAILVEAGKHKFIVDAGSGMRERLFQAGGFKLITGVDTLLITHLHFDHTISIPGLWLSGWLYGRRIPMHIYGPAGINAMMAHLQKAYQWDVDYRAVVGVPLQGVELKTTEVKPGVFFNKDGMIITAFEVEHMPINIETGERLSFRGQTLGFRIDYKGHSVVFSGDTRSTKSSKLLKYGKGVDVLIHEVQVPSAGESKEARLANVSLSVHSTPTQAAYIFSQTRPRMAVYSHIIPPDMTAEALTTATRPFYSGPLTVAHDLMTITIGDDIVIGQKTIRAGDVFEKSSVLR